MAKKKREFETEGVAVETVAELPLAKRQLWMVTDPGSPRYKQNWRIIAFVEPGQEGDPAKVKYQFQIPLGPGKPEEHHTSCPNCGFKKPGMTLVIPATRQTDERNEVKVSTEAELRREWREAGAVMVEKGLIDVEVV